MELITVKPLHVRNYAFPKKLLSKRFKLSESEIMCDNCKSSEKQSSELH